MIYLALFFVLLIIMLLYFKVADRFNIIDKPNERSSHSEVTLRGGGIIFLFAILFGSISAPGYWMPVLGALIMGAISFIDDLITLSSKIRIVIHIIAVSLMFAFLNIFSMSFYWCLVLYIAVVGIVNMYNFMDGINGITGCYTLVILSGLLYIDLYKIPFISSNLIIIPILACVIFLIFNFRKRAICFAGDVGSVTVAFWLVFLVLKLILQTDNWVYILFFAVYIVDSGLTILHRLILRQNIFQAHRTHIYQLLANEQKMSHRSVSLLYSAIQMIIISFLIFNNRLSVIVVFAIVMGPLISTYLLIKPALYKQFKV